MNLITLDGLTNEQNPASVQLTAMYAAQPALRVLALESTSLPEIPKSHNFMFPSSSRRMLEGFTSR